MYFVFRDRYRHLGLGNYSVLREIEQCREMGLDYYYLGYYVKGNAVMEYKTRFYPYERYNWNVELWETVEKEKEVV